MEKQRRKEQIRTTTNNNGGFAGKVAFVTGAANGIGRAAAVDWLCSDAAAFVVGRVMVIDGGQTV